MRAWRFGLVCQSPADVDLDWHKRMLVFGSHHFYHENLAGESAAWINFSLTENHWITSIFSPLSSSVTFERTPFCPRKNRSDQLGSLKKPLFCNERPETSDSLKFNNARLNFRNFKFQSFFTRLGVLEIKSCGPCFYNLIKIFLFLSAKYLRRESVIRRQHRVILIQIDIHDISLNPVNKRIEKFILTILNVWYINHVQLLVFGYNLLLRIARRFVRNRPV